MAPNPFNNIHNDSWFTDSYTGSGPATVESVDVEVISKFIFDDPVTGKPRFVELGECPAHTYDAQGNLLTVCAGLPDPVTKQFLRSIAAISPDGELLAWSSFTVSFTSLAEAFLEFGGIGYFYLDAQERIVMGMPNGHIVTWERQDSAVSEVDRWVSVRDVNITGRRGALPRRLGSLYALVPAENGYLWFTTRQGGVGTVAPDCTRNCVKWIDINDLDGDGAPNLQSDGGLQTISESHSVHGNSTFQQSDYFMYRFDMKADGTPIVAWRAPYERGVRVKPGQTSRGSGTSPVYFEMGGREFVTIMDNAIRPHINVYRAEPRLRPGEERLFASERWAGRNGKVSDENSLIVSPGSAPNSRRIYGENNWGNTSLVSTAGPLVTEPGLGGIEVSADGRVQVLPLNTKIRVPSVVSKASIPSDAVYTYEKRPTGWYLTALNSGNPQQTLWSARVGGGVPKYNNWYAQLSLAPDGETFHVGATTGVLAIRPADGPPPPGWCSSFLDAQDFLVIMRDLAEWTGGPIWHPDYLQAAFPGWKQEFARLAQALPGDDAQLHAMLDALEADLRRAERILRNADYDVSKLSPAAKQRLLTFAEAHRETIAAAFIFWGLHCTTIEIDPETPENLRILLYRAYLPTGGFDAVPLPDITLVQDGVETALAPCRQFTDNAAWERLYTSAADPLGVLLALSESPGFNPPDGPFPFCGWWGVVTIDNFNIAAPDQNAAYWFMPFIADENLEVYIDGVYPDARYMSLTLYNPSVNPYEYNEVDSWIPDYLINPNPGSLNPWQVAAPPGGGYRVTIEADPQNGQANELPWFQTSAEGTRGTMPAPCGDPGAMNLACPIENMFISPPQDDQSSIFSNPNNRYMMNLFDPEKVYVLRGKLPTTPLGTHPVPWPDPKYQLRYFSICDIIYVRPYPAVENNGCAVDYEIPTDGDRMYTIVYSTAKNRPKNATLDNGIAWVRAFPGVRNFLVMRHMLPSEGFEQAAQNVPQDAAWTSAFSVMGDYYPATTIECTAPVFEISPTRCFVPPPPAEAPPFMGVPSTGH